MQLPPDAASAGDTDSASGTPDYMAPEGSFSIAADIYSIGATLYHLLAKEPPSSLKNLSMGEKRQSIQCAPTVPLRNHDQTIPKELERICDRCMTKSPDDRYSTAADLADDLSRFLDPLPEDEDAEQRLLGGMLSDQAIVPEAIMLLQEEDFSDHAHADIFREICRLTCDEGKSLDIKELSAGLPRVARAYLDQLVQIAASQEIPESTTCVEWFGQRVRNAAALRNLIALASQAVRDARASDRSAAEDVTSLFFDRLLQLLGRFLPGTVVDFRDVLLQVYDRLDEWHRRYVKQPPWVEANERDIKRPEAILPREWTIPDARLAPELEGIVSRAEKAGFTLVQQPPDKTFALAIAAQFALKQRQPTLFITPNRTAMDVVEGILVEEARFDPNPWPRRLSEDDLEELFAADGRIRDVKLFLDPYTAPTLARISATALSLIRRRGVTIIVVDAIERLQNSAQDEHAVITELRALARGLIVPIVGIANVGSPNSRYGNPDSDS